MLSLNHYAKQYGWYKSSRLYQPRVRFGGANGSSLGGSNLIALPLSYYETNVYYNKSLMAKAGIKSLPTTLSAFEADLAQAKAAGILPIQLGNKQGHSLFVFQEIAQSISGAQPIDNWVFGKPNLSTLHTPSTREAVSLTQKWEQDGYFPSATQVNGTDLAGSSVTSPRGKACSCSTATGMKRKSARRWATMSGSSPCRAPT